MVTKHEAIAAAFWDAMIATSSLTVMREEELPQKCPANGLINLRFEDAEQTGQQLGVGTREWQRVVTIELVVQKTDQAARIAKFEAALIEIGEFPTAGLLGGLVDFIDFSSVQETDDVPMEGAAQIKAGIIPFTLYYETSTNPLEVS